MAATIVSHVKFYCSSKNNQMLQVSEQEHYNQERDTNRGFID